MIRMISLFMMSTLLSASLLAQGGKELVYQDGATTLKGYSARPAQKAANDVPGVVVIHAWMGITDHEKHVVDMLGLVGYHALAADIYGTPPPKNTQEAGQLSGRYKKDYKTYQNRIRAAIAALVKQGANPDKIVVMGYCFGGTGALEAARGGLPVAGVVSFHGGLGKDSSRANVAIKPKVLVLHGADDPYVPAKDFNNFQQEMRDGKADWQLVSFGNAVHAFTEKKAGNDNSKGAAYNQLADERSQEYFMNFLRELFPR